jgi:hypothetical protein
MYPIYLGSAFMHEAGWFEYIAKDPSYLHAVVFTSQSYLDGARGKTALGQLAAKHLAKTLVLLQQRLQDESLATSESTIGTVVALVLIADAVGDMETAVKHLDGLCRIIELRGGVSSLSHAIQLQVKVCR